MSQNFRYGNYLGGVYITDDYLVSVKKGLVPGQFMVNKFGRNEAVANNVWEHISLLSSSTAFRSSAATMRIKAGGDAADTALGLGAREVIVQGIDSAFNETKEAIPTNGAVASVTTTTFFWRVHRAWVSAVGTYGESNTAAVTIEDSAGANDMIMIGVEEGQTQYTGWTVPASHTAYFLGMHAHVDSKKIANIRVFNRDDIDITTAPMKPKRLKLFFDGVAGNFMYEPRGSEFVANAKSDIWVEGLGDGAACEISADFELLVVEDGFN